MAQALTRDTIQGHSDYGIREIEQMAKRGPGPEVPEGAVPLYVPRSEYKTRRENGDWPDHAAAAPGQLEFAPTLGIWYVTPNHPQFDDLRQAYSTDAAKARWDAERNAGLRIERQVSSVDTIVPRQFRAHLLLTPGQQESLRAQLNAVDATYDRVEGKYSVDSRRQDTQQLIAQYSAGNPDAVQAYEEAERARAADKLAKRAAAGLLPDSPSLARTVATSAAIGATVAGVTAAAKEGQLAAAGQAIKEGISSAHSAISDVAAHPGAYTDMAKGVIESNLGDGLQKLGHVAGLGSLEAHGSSLIEAGRLNSATGATELGIGHLGDQVREAISNLQGNVGALSDTVGNGLHTAGQHVGATVHDAAASLAGATTSAPTTAQIAEGITKLGQGALDAARNAGHEVGTFAAAVGDKAQQGYDAVKGVIVAPDVTAHQIGDALTAGANAAKDGILHAAGNAKVALTAAANVGLDKSTSAIHGAAQAVADSTVGGTLGSAISTAQDAVGGAATAVQHAATSVGAAGSGAMTKLFGESVTAKVAAVTAGLGHAAGAAATGGAMAVGSASALWLAKRQMRLKQYERVAKEAPWTLTPKEFGQVASRLYSSSRVKLEDGREQVTLTSKDTGKPVYTAIADKAKVAMREAVTGLHLEMVGVAQQKTIAIPDRVLEAHAKEADRAAPAGHHRIAGRTQRVLDAIGQSVSRLPAHASERAAGVYHDAKALGVKAEHWATQVIGKVEVRSKEIAEETKGHLKSLSPEVLDLTMARTKRLLASRAMAGDAGRAAALSAGVGLLQAEINGRLAEQQKVASQGLGSPTPARGRRDRGNSL